MSFNRNMGSAQKRSSPPLGFSGGPTKKFHFGPDLSALPTHLPGSASGPGTLNLPHNSFPSSLPAIPSLPPIPNFANSRVNPEPGPASAPTTETPLTLNTPTGAEIESTQVDSSENIDEVKQKEKSGSEPIFIEGTNISLQTEEDIANWIAERKKRWPTRKNVELKLQEQKEQEKEAPPTAPKHQNICKFYARNRRCKFGNKCRNVHESGTNSANNNNSSRGGSAQSQSGSSTRKVINGMAVNIPQRYKNEVNGAGSLFTKLVQRDLYEHENNVVIDFIQFLDSKGLIKHDAHAS